MRRIAGMIGRTCWFAFAESRSETCLTRCCSDPMSIPVEHVDDCRTTVANLDTAGEKSMSDIWNGTIATSRTLSDLWACETRFLKLWKAPLGYDVVDGSVTRR